MLRSEPLGKIDLARELGQRQASGSLHDAIRTLAKVGVLLRSPRTTPHGKMVHLNGKRAMFGSANLAKGSLRGGALEAAIVIEDQASLAGTKNAFDHRSKAFFMGFLI